MLNCFLALWVPEQDMTNGYFVLADVLTRMPKDVAITHMWSSFSSGHMVIRLHSKEFPPVGDGEIVPRADFKYDSNTGISIEWPNEPFRELALKILNQNITETVNKEMETIEVPRFSMEEFQKTLGIHPTSVQHLDICNHEWFAYGRHAATKHCKKCAKVSENV